MVLATASETLNPKQAAAKLLCSGALGTMLHTALHMQPDPLHGKLRLPDCNPNQALTLLGCCAFCCWKLCSRAASRNLSRGPCWVSVLGDHTQSSAPSPAVADACAPGSSELVDALFLTLTAPLEGGAVLSAQLCMQGMAPCLPPGAGVEPAVAAWLTQSAAHAAGRLRIAKEPNSPAGAGPEPAVAAWLAHSAALGSG